MPASIMEGALERTPMPGAFLWLIEKPTLVRFISVRMMAIFAWMMQIPLTLTAPTHLV